MIWRLIKWILGLALVLALVVFIVLPLLANTEAGRAHLAEVLSEALDREVTLGGLDVGLFYSSLDVEDLEVSNPEGYPPGAMLRAGALDFDANFRKLLDGRVEGGLEGRGLQLHIMRKGDGTNLDGLAAGDPDVDEDEGDGPDLDLSLRLGDSRLTIEDLDKGEKLVLDGVGLEMRLTNRKGASDVGIKIVVRSIDRGDLKVRNLQIDARKVDELLALDRLTAELPGGGRLIGNGRLRVQGGDDWNVKLDAKDVNLESDIMSIVGALYPFAASTGGQVDGTLNAQFDVTGRGLTWEAMKPNLAGTGKVTLTGMSLPAESLLGQATRLAGRKGGALDLNNTGAQFRVANGWLAFQRLSASGKDVRYDLAGRVSLDGDLDLTMDLLPLVKQFGGGSAYREASKYVKQLPLRIGGTTDGPKLRPPKLEDVAGGAIEKGLGDILDKLGKRKKKGG